MLVAFLLATHCLPQYSDKFSRHDFTLPQLFACLVIREHQKKSYRGVEALLRDCPDWLAVWLMIIADNTMHGVCNWLALP